jgi:ribosomal protein L37AE/L43A
MRVSSSPPGYGHEKAHRGHEQGYGVPDHGYGGDDNGQFSRSSLVSRDKFEEEIEAKKAAKAHECSSTRKRLGYDKALRDKVLGEMKLVNQLLWKCRDCEISCAKPGMEKHIQLKNHWDKVLDNYCRKLDGLSQDSVF